jgi:alanyl-tRNA synthetase
MTERLYYTDPYVRSFEATVDSVVERDGHTVVFLDRTAFYPTSGGQPFDTGTLGGARVVDVIDDEDGRIAHVVEHQEPQHAAPSHPAPSTQHLAPGGAVSAAVDWPRRFDHMQQHTGQHVLSAAFVRLFGVRTVSFHLGADVSTIDLDREMKADEIAAAEAGANQIVWEDRPVSIRFASKEEAAALPLRKEPLRDGTLRLIDIEQWDLSACGGTHVARTGAIGIVAVAGWERFKGGQRITFVCGGRALARFGTMRDTLAASVRLLSVLPQELPATIERLQSDAKEQKRSIVGLQSELAGFRAAALAEAAEPTTAGRLVLQSIDADAQGLKSLAKAVTEQPGFVAVFTSTASPALVVVARSADLQVSAQQLLASLIADFGGRGGGKSDLAQGGGLNATASAILGRARTLLLP